MSKTYEEREKITVNGIEYLIDRDDKTAWVNRAATGGAIEYTLPESVVIDGERYICCSVEIGAYWNEPNLEILSIPDTYTYIDADCFKFCEKLYTVHIGAGLERYIYWSFGGSSLRTVTISPDNPYLKVSEDGNLILSKDGKEVYEVVEGRKINELVVPEGVETLSACAISCCSIGHVHLPTSLKTIDVNGIFQCDTLAHLSIPEGVTEIGHQGIAWLENLLSLELPSTLKRYSYGMLALEHLESLVIHGDRVLEIEDASGYDPFHDIPVDRITLHVPKHLANSYRNHPQWGRFYEIKP